MPLSEQEALFSYVLAIGDDLLVLGHRLSEYCGKAPTLEEELALGNIALDCLGQASALLELAAEIEGKGRSNDDLAFFREAIDYRNLLLVEQPNLDFAHTMVRQCFFDAFMLHFFEQLGESKHEKLAGIAQKALKETIYHLRHSGEWVVCLGDGTAVSKEKTQAAVDSLWTYTAELFEELDAEEQLVKAGLVPEREPLQSKWKKTIGDVLQRATLSMPSDEQYMNSGGRRGFHSEHLGYLLAEMQIVPRSFPGAKW